MGTVLAFLVLLFSGCGDDGMPSPPDAGPADAPLPDGGMDGGQDAGPSCTVLMWEPGSGEITRWPEPELVVDDATTGTGVRLSFDEDRYAATLAVARGFGPVFTEDLPDVDGFGINSEIFFRFGRAFDPTMLPSGE